MPKSSRWNLNSGSDEKVLDEHASTIKAAALLKPGAGEDGAFINARRIYTLKTTLGSWLHQKPR